MSGFEELGLLPTLVQGVEDMGWYLPKPIQQEAIPMILGGGDVMCAAETGSGKTGAFCLPMIQVTWENLNRRVTRRSATRCVINTEDCNTNAKVSVDGALCQCHDPRSWSGARCTYGVTSGKWYYEAVVVEDDGIVRVGYSSLKGGLELGKDAHGFGYGGTGKKSFSGVFEDYGGKFGVGDRVGCAIDFTIADNKQNTIGAITFYKNGVSLGEAFRIPAALKGESLHPTLCIKNSLVQMVFAGSGLKHLPKGFKPIDDATGSEQDAIAAEFQRQKRERQTGHGPTCIVIEPTLELANQVIDETYKFTKYVSEPKLKMSSIVGRREFREILTELRRGADIVVGTPGKMESFFDSGELNLSQVRFLILDEADRFAAEHFNLVTKMYKKIQDSNNGKTQVCMFSATLHSPEIKQLAEAVCPRAVWIDLKGKEYIPETVHHAVVYVDPKEAKWQPAPGYATDGVHQEDRMQGDVYGSQGTKHMKPQVLVQIIDAHKMSQCLIFCRTRLDCDLLSDFLTAKGGKKGSGSRVEKGKENAYSNVVLHSGYSARQRAENLDLFKEGFVRFLICTDVAARGIDITALPYVINMTLPDKPEDYIHRIGRTGRADRMGLAISIVSRAKEKVWYHTCPSRGDNCYNTNVATPVPGKGAGAMQGGCCIWYNEPSCALAIQQRLKMNFDELDPKTFQYHVKKDEEEGAVDYGRSRGEKSRASGLSPERQKAIQAVSAMDQQAQLNFIRNASTIGALFAA